jgi:hypothetical protein
MESACHIHKKQNDDYSHRKLVEPRCTEQSHLNSNSAIGVDEVR